MRRILFAPALLALAASLSAAAQGVLTLPEALRLAGKTSLQADTARLDEASSREDTQQVKALYYPEVTLQGGHVNLDNPIVVLFERLAAPSTPSHYWQYDLSFRQVVWDFGKRSSALAASRQREQAVTFQGGASVRRAQAEVAARYMALMTVKAEKGVIAQRRQALTDHLRIVKDLYEQGVVARNDLLRTEVALRSVDDADRSADNAYATAAESLNVSLGRDPQAPATLPDSLPPPPPLPWSEESCRQEGAHENDTVRALEAKVQGLQDQLRLRRRAYFPNLIAQADTSYQQNPYLLYPHMNALFLGLSWSVFDGGVRDSKIVQAQTEVDKALRQLTEVQRQAEAEAGTAYRDYSEALAETQTARANVSASEENLRIEEDQYKAGLARTTDVLDAESVLAQSRFQLVERYYRAYTRQAALLADLGKDLPGFYADVESAAPPKENLP